MAKQPSLFSVISELGIPERGLESDSAADRNRFVEAVWDFYRRNRREMPWRDDTSPYSVFVSEVMLQQTQVSRVMEKYPPFIHRFPTFASLAEAPLGDLLAEWSGLGYNRRAKYLQNAAKTIVEEHGGTLPSDPELLVHLPGIGPNTAGSIAAFAFNKPVVFIETNIRRVVIAVFYSTETRPIHDREILPIVEATLPRENPREWYWALMDLGVVIGRRGDNPNRRSAHYVRQSPFQGSDRQLRGAIVRLLSERGAIVAEQIPEYTGFPRDQVERVLERLTLEEIVILKKNEVRIVD